MARMVLDGPHRTRIWVWCPECEEADDQPPGATSRVCEACDDWTQEDEDALEEYEDNRRRRIAEANEY